MSAEKAHLINLGLKDGCRSDDGFGSDGLGSDGLAAAFVGSSLWGFILLILNDDKNVFLSILLGEGNVSSSSSGSCLMVTEVSGEHEDIGDKSESVDREDGSSRPIDDVDFLLSKLVSF